MNVIVTHLSIYGYKSKKHVRMNGPVSLESINLYVPCLLSECVLYKQKRMTQEKEKKEIARERNGKRQRKGNDETNVKSLFSIRLHSHYGACDVSLKLKIRFF